MGKRIIWMALIGLVIGTAAGLFIFRDRIAWLDFGSSEFTEEIPKSRPKRVDRKLISRFEGKPMVEILHVLTAESSEKRQPSSPPENELLAALPTAPLPFPETVAPANESWLREFVTGIQNAENSNPSETDLWKFNLALAALHISPDQLPESLRRETTPTPESDTLTTKWINHDSTLTGPFAIGDFDGDGGDEIIDGGGARILEPAASGGATETERRQDTALEYPGEAIYPCDFDRDGDLDFFLLRGKGFPDSLLRNEGNLRFIDVTIEVGLLAFRDSSVAAWTDFDRDGDPDLVVGSSDQPLELYRQVSPGQFVGVAWDSGLWVPKGVRGISTADLNGDGYPEFHVWTDSMSDQLLANRGGKSDGRRFVDISHEIGATLPSDAESLFLDADEDGNPDLFTISRGTEKPGTLSFFRNLGELSFEEVTEETGLAGVTNADSFHPVDFDNDGFLDLYVGTAELRPNRFFWNRAELGFREISVSSGATFLDRPIAFASADWGSNGASDLFFATSSGAVRHLEANGDLNAWLHFRVPGAVPDTRISLVARDSDWILHRFERRIDSSGDILAGIGEAKTVESVRLFLPGSKNTIRSMEDIDPNQSITIDLRAKAGSNKGSDFATPTAP